MTVKTHIVIPARLRSTRLSNKPLLNIHDRPMILWTAQKAQQAVQAGVACDYCVATDAEAIVAVCQAAGVPVVLTSKEHVSGTDRLGEVANLQGYGDEDIVLNLQGDEPLVPACLLAQLKMLLLNNPHCAMATLQEPITTLAEFRADSVVKVVSAGSEALYFSRSPIPYHRDNPTDISAAYRHLGLYAYRVHLLKAFGTWAQATLERLESLEQLRILAQGHKIAIATASVALPVGVDTPEDLARLNAMPYEAIAAYG